MSITDLVPELESPANFSLAEVMRYPRVVELMIVWSTLLRHAYQADLSIGKPFGTRTRVPKSNLVDRNLPFSAIVGGGIGGTSCANFLREIFRDSAKIDVYEGDKVGGRLATVVMNDGNEYETGGSVIHRRNKYMSDFVSNLGWWRLCEPVVRSPRD